MRRRWGRDPPHFVTVLPPSGEAALPSLLSLPRRPATGRALPAATGMALAGLAFLMFALHDACIKWLVGQGMPVWEVLFARSAMICTVCVAAGRTRMLERAIATPIKRILIGRGAITLVAWLCFYSAARDLPLAQLLTLYFAAPIMTTLLAVRMLKERVTPARWLSVLVGFAGVVVACDPGGVALSWATGRVLMAAAFWGYAMILMRQTAMKESNLLLMFYTNTLFLLAMTAACAVFGWQTPHGWALLLLFGVGVLGAAGQLALFEAMRHAPASVIATVEYTALIWAFVLGFLIWGDIPHLAVFAGAGLIFAAGTLLVVTERRPG